MTPIGMVTRMGHTYMPILSWRQETDPIRPVHTCRSSSSRISMYVQLHCNVKDVTGLFSSLSAASSNFLTTEGACCLIC